MKKIFNYIMLTVLAVSGMTLAACSEDDLDTNQYNKSGVNILAFGPMPVTRGETIRLTGTKLDKVKEVIFPEGNQKLKPSKTYIAGDFTLASKEEMTVTIPDMCVPGKLRLVTQSNDTIVSVSNISFVEEIKVSDINPKQVHPGDIVTITGEYVWNIAEITFAAGIKVEAEDFLVNTRKEIKVRVPIDAVTGDVTCNDGSENAETIVITDNLIVDAAKAISTDKSSGEYEFGSPITIIGENLDLVTNVTFAPSIDVDFNVSSNGNEIYANVPMNTVGGTVVLTSASGLTTTVEVAVPLATYLSVTPNEDVREGDEVAIAGTLLDRIQKLILPGDITLEKGEFTQTSTSIKFTVPEGMGDGVVTMVQHENYSVATDKIGMHHEGSEIPIWQGECVVGGWDNSLGALSWGGYDWSTVVAGQTLSVYVTPNMNGDYGPQIRLGNGSWQALPSTVGWGADGNLNLTADDNVVRVTLTQADIDQLVNAGGLVVCGAWFTVTKVTLSALETVLWVGEAVADNWSNQPYVLSDAGAELKAVDAQPGQAVNFYLTPIEPGWKLEIVEGHWGPSYGAWCAFGEDTENGKFTEWDLDANGGKVTLYLTQEMLDKAYTMQQWGGVFVLNGDNVKCTKITIE